MQHKDYYDGRDYSLNPLINLETMLFSLNLFNTHWYKVIQVFYNPFSGEKEKWRGGGGGVWERLQSVHKGYNLILQWC